MRPTKPSTLDPTVLEAVLQRDRLVVATCLIAVTAAAWIWILLGAGVDMDGAGSSPVASGSDNGMADMAMGVMAPMVWTPGYAVLMVSMWWVMMIAMMLPSAAPMLLLFARVNRKEKASGRPYVPTAIFAAGYLTVWGGFSVMAAAAQWGLQRLGLISPAMVTTSVVLGAAILLAAGAWQLTPIKHVCLRHCRSPISFLLNGWRSGRGGAFRMGREHGAYCLGCCWFLMALLFVGGIMNLYWVIGLAALVLIEKTVPMGQWVARTAGAVLVIWGVALLVLAA
jgi:predicted metal-binding membrane protein